MKKYAACLYFTAACTLGCRNLAQRTGPEAHACLSSQAVSATSLKPALAKLTVNIPETDPAKGSSAKAQNTETEHALTKTTLKAIETTPAALQKDRGTVAVAGVLGPTSKDALEDALCNGVRRAVRAAVDVEIVVSHSVAASFLAATIFMKDVEEKQWFAHQQVRNPHSDQALQPDVAKKVWYCLVWIGGAVFTSILAPLIVELIKLRLGFADPSPTQTGRLSSRKPT
jgi:hypothetical protein